MSYTYDLTDMMNSNYCYELKDFIGLVVDNKMESIQPRKIPELIRDIDIDNEEQLVSFIKDEVKQDEILEAIQEYDQDYAICHMDDYVDKINFAECIVGIVDTYGGDVIEGLDAKSLWRLVKVIAFQEVCKAQYFAIINK